VPCGGQHLHDNWQNAGIKEPLCQNVVNRNPFLFDVEHPYNEHQHEFYLWTIWFKQPLNVTHYFVIDSIYCVATVAFKN
jgi:hypothetical protein